MPVLCNVTGSGSIIKTGAATTSLSGSNSYAGNTTVNQRTLVLSQTTLAASSTITVASNAVLQLDFPTTNTVAILRVNGVVKSPETPVVAPIPVTSLARAVCAVTSSGPPTLWLHEIGDVLQFALFSQL